MVWAFFTSLKQFDDQTVSQAQGYPPPPATIPPGEQNNGGYPGPSYGPPPPEETYPPISVTASYTTWVPSIARYNLPEKKGMVWTYYPLTNIDPWNPVGIGWFYTYGPKDYFSVHGQIEFVPFWHCDNFTPEEMLTYVPGTYNGYFLWLNEPDTNEAAGCRPLNDVDLAAAFYIEMREAYPYAKFIGPHTYHGNDQAHTNALEWVGDWRQAVYDHPDSTRPGGIYGEYPDVVGYGIHLYHTNPNRNLFYLSNFYNLMVSWGEGDRELWVTEFTYCNGDSLAEDIQNTVNEFETRSYVDRYAYWQDRGVTPTPSPTPGFGDEPGGTGQEFELLGWCIDPGRAITLFDPNTGWTTLSPAGEIYSQVGNE